MHHWKRFGLKHFVLCSEAWNSHWRKKKKFVDKRKGVQRGEGDSCPRLECSLATVKHRQCYSFQRKQRQNSGLISSVRSREVPGHARSSLNTCRPSSLSTRKPVITHKQGLTTNKNATTITSIAKTLSLATVYHMSAHTKEKEKCTSGSPRLVFIS